MPTGRQALQIPGPTNVPQAVLDGLKTVFETDGPVLVYPASGTGAWQAALVDTLPPGNAVLMVETGWFASLWAKMAGRLGLAVETILGDWRTPIAVVALEAALVEDRAHRLKAVAVVHHETSTGVVSDIAAVRRAIDAAGRPARLMVDTISSLGSMDYSHRDWGVDVTIGCSQKGLMLPPGLSFNAVSEKALHAAASARLPRAFWDWGDMLAANRAGLFPYTPSTNLLQGLKVAIDRLQAAGLDAVLARHAPAAEATRRCVRQWGVDLNCTDPNAFSASLTAVRLPAGRSPDALRADILARCDMSLGNGPGRLADVVLRIGHLGDFDDSAVMATPAGTEIGLRGCAIPYREGGLGAAIAALGGNVAPAETA